MIIFMAIKQLTSFFFLFIWNNLKQCLRFSLRIHHPQCAPFDILCRANIWPGSHNANSIYLLYIYIRALKITCIWRFYLYICMNASFLCMLRIHSKDKKQHSICIWYNTFYSTILMYNKCIWALTYWKICMTPAYVNQRKRHSNLRFRPFSLFLHLQDLPF